MLHKLIFDTTSAATMADSHSVGAFLRASDGTLLTHTDVAGKKALDVRVAEGINVEVDLDHADDSVKIGDGTDFLLINADGSINAVVTATNLDIRDLAFATDKVDVSGSAVSISGTVTVSDAALANTAIASASNPLAADNTAEDLVTAPLANRKYLFAYNNGNRTAFVGATGVTAANGFPIPPGSMMSMRAGAAIDIEWVAASAGGSDMRTMELS